MRMALRLARLGLASLAFALVLAAAAPTPALAGPPAHPSKAPAKESKSEGGGLVVVVVLVGLVVLGAGGLLAFRKLSGGSGRGAGKGDGRAPEPILPQRKHDWELRLTEEQESAMLRGIQAYRDGGHSLYLSHDDALITFYEPRRMLVSLHHLTGAFLDAGPAGVADPPGTLRRLLDGCAAGESPGVVHLREGWYGAPVDGLDFAKFSDLCYDTLTRPKPYLEGTQGSSADEKSGHMTLKVEVGGPLNTLCVDLGRVLPAVLAARGARPSEPLIELVRPVLQGMSSGALPGAMWTRGAASPAEKELVSRVVATSAARAA